MVVDQWKCRNGVTSVNCNDILFLFNVSMSFNGHFTKMYFLSISKGH